MKPAAVFVFASLQLFTPVAWAKRSPPANVAPVTVGKIEYRVPHSQMGCIEAWDSERNQMLWRRQVYVVKYRIDLERDVQDTFITSVMPQGGTLQGGTLVVRNERGSEYLLDLETLEVKVVKGALIESSK